MYLLRVDVLLEHRYCHTTDFRFHHLSIHTSRLHTYTACVDRRPQLEYIHVPTQYAWMCVLVCARESSLQLTQPVQNLYRLCGDDQSQHSSQRLVVGWLLRERLFGRKCGTIQHRAVRMVVSQVSRRPSNVCARWIRFVGFTSLN